RSPGAEKLFVPSWLPDGPPQRLLAFRGDVPYLVVTGRDGSRAVLLGVRLDERLARHLNESGWFDVYFYVAKEGFLHSTPTFVVQQGQGGRVLVQDHAVPVENVWGPWPAPQNAGWLDRPLVGWFRVAGKIVDLKTGQCARAPGLITLLRTSPAAVWRDFVRAPFALGEKIRNALTGTALVLGILYLIVVGIAVLMILAITRAVARLSRGAREISRGNLDHRIPVKRRDQLGDLALSFNGMADAVQRMLTEVREKERLAHELELARQIQENLLPGRRLSLGEVEVRASFRPAAEVGGDYFDVLVPEKGRVIAAVGDVAGHGLATGLFMASVKSAVAAFVGEGYRGVELLERLKELMDEGNRQHRQPMVTLAVAEIDVNHRTVRLASAGHPPAFVLHRDGSVEEVLLGSMPLGFPRCRPRESVVELEPGATLVLYSDGLVEAVDGRDEAFGYERLRRLLEEGPAAPDTVLERLERALEGHAAGRPLADDVTIVVAGISKDVVDPNIGSLGPKS
ncbi:MAG TPA: HAMP domain-containing protein, partial [Acidobacteria bacterium]|nr:HAMP domain-containing protein [Acidobacteriota bacterium]